MMIFILREVLNVLLPPGDFIVLAILAAIVAARLHRRWPVIAALVILWGLMTPWLGVSTVHALEYAYARPKRVAGDVLVVLGEGAVADTPQNQGLGNVSGSMANELLTVARLERRTHLPILISGGQGSFGAGNESDIGRRILRGLGIHDVYIDNHSRTTYQNAANSAAILRQHHWTRPILVTSAFHMVQAVEDFGAEGVTVVPFPTDYQTPRELKWSATDLIPSVSGLDLTAEALQEYLSLAAFRLGIIR